MISTREFQAWITQYHQAIYKHALWFSGHADIASEAVQETYYQAWRSRHTLKDKDLVFPWLLTILRRAITHEYKNWRVVNFSEAIPEAFEYGDTEALMDLRQAMQKLPDNQREILLLYNLQNFSYEEISVHLEIPLGTVMSRLSRARQMLKTLLSADNTNNVIPLRQRAD